MAVAAAFAVPKKSIAADQSAKSPEQLELAEFKLDIQNKVQAVHDKISNMEEMLQAIMHKVAK